jgi:hypothetical protein
MDNVQTHNICAVVTILLLKSILPHYKVIKHITLNNVRALTTEKFYLMTFSYLHKLNRFISKATR